ncbi:MAG: CinA family nicotinamide mononucleotide deamidase-related protein [Bacteroidales bacterium]|nr:CinA family nicotinamide mononucleotide deamidase-related protein [Bacteroidales bacterium]
MKVKIINIGDELLIGQVVNTNAARMSQLLTEAGMEVDSVETIGDDGSAIENTLSNALASADAVLVTGGLGPTKDDITKNVLCRMFDSELVESEVALDNVKRIFAARGYELTPVNRAQALVPRCCKVLNNDLGTAPCMWFERDERVTVSLPGVPFEMEWLMKNRVIPALREHFNTGTIINKNILVQGISESFLSDLIEPWETSLPANVKLAYLPVAGMVKLRLTARMQGNADTTDINSLLPGLYALAGKHIVGEDCETMEELVARAMTSRHLTLATAESCTGGAIAQRLTALAGASEYFRGGVVAYSNDVKINVLGVSTDTLATHGAVSEETVREMAEGARTRLGADYAVATSGVAGPSGGTPEKPVGTVWTAIAGPDGTIAKLLHYGDRRQQTIDRTCNQVLADIVRRVAL